ncbi:FxDxF family PEP-CTERM protein [Niveibacterium sp. SC-1]|uniref:FxDxF family PEP-CTERM protein n=1 Tax=Niveibacterium sp. SC-1 TaxID=3135646 RepID=UPI00311DA5FA
MSKLLRKLFLPLAVSAAAIGANPAHAVSLGALSASPSFLTLSTPNTADIFGGLVTFNLTSPSDVTIGLQGLNALFAGAALFDSSFNQIGEKFFADSTQTFSGLSSGLYNFAVAGLSNAGGGGVALTAYATAVPEPESYAMLLAGLGMLMLIVRRRSGSM